jgi:putative oxidoreductase
MRGLLDPKGLGRFEALSLLLLRLFVGAFMIYGVWDNITDAARMAEFATFLTTIGCPMPEIAAPLSVWAQFAVGVAFILGLFTRWAGVLLAINFVVAFLLICRTGASFRDLYPPTILIFVGLVYAAHGARGLGLDAILGRGRVARF